MQIQILSDLHLDPLRPDDPYTYDIPVCAEYLALLGDTGRTCDERLFKWLDVQLTKFRIVFYLSGNNGMYQNNVIIVTGPDSTTHFSLDSLQSRADPL